MRGWVRRRLARGRIVSIESLSNDGVRGFELNISKLVFYTAKSSQERIIQFERIANDRVWGFQVTVLGRTFVFYAEKQAIFKRRE